MFAMSGTHRSGKSSLAKAAAAKLDIPYIDADVASVFAELKISPKEALPFGRRLGVQGMILRHMETKLALAKTSSHNGVFITDRSPYDVLGYTMADVQRDTLDDDMRYEIGRQIRLAQEIVASNLLGIITVPSFPNPPEADTSAQACPFYMDHVAVCIQACMNSYPVPHLMAMVVESSGLEERIAEVVGTLEPIVQRINRSAIWTPGQK